MSHVKNKPSLNNEQKSQHQFIFRITDINQEATSELKTDPVKRAKASCKTHVIFNCLGLRSCRIDYFLLPNLRRHIQALYFGLIN